MLFERFSSSSGLVGVDYGTRGIKMLQISEHQGRLHVVGAARLDVPLIAVRPATDGTNASALPVPEFSQQTDAKPSAIAADAGAIARMAEQIRAAFVNGGFTGRKCVVSLAREDVRVQSLRLPSMPDEELRQTASWEAAQRFGFDRNAMQVDFIRTGATLANGENREEVILVAASHAAIHARVEPLLAAGLRPVAVDTGFAALVRTFSRRVRREADQSIVRVVVEIGASGSTVLILRGDQIAFCKPLSISGRMFDQAVAEHLQINEQDASHLRQMRIAQSAGATGSDSPRESSDAASDSATERAVYTAVRSVMGELVKEITMCLRYYGVTFRGHPPERIVLAGGDSLEPHLADVVHKGCKLPVMFDDAPGELTTLLAPIQKCLNRSAGPAPSWAAALGLSLRGLINRRSKTKQATVDQGLRGAAA